jgi:hypothetical protein
MWATPFEFCNLGKRKRGTRLVQKEPEIVMKPVGLGGWKVLVIFTAFFQIPLVFTLR